MNAHAATNANEANACALHANELGTDARGVAETKRSESGHGRKATPESDARDAPVHERRRSRLAGFGIGFLKHAATILAFLAAVVAALLLWHTYVLAPWTRDGRVRAQVANVAPQVSGRITEIRVVDNQYVHVGDVLYVIDPFDFKNAVDAATQQVEMTAADYRVKIVQAQRRASLSDLAASTETKQTYAGSAAQAEATFKSAQARKDLAEVNLKRTVVRSPSNGYVTNLLMRVGDYAREGTSNLSVIDADSYWVDGYFEETKMARVCVGAPVTVQLMGYAAPMTGVVDTVTRGISVSNATMGTQNLPNVDAIYTWVRLAQRVPVRIRLVSVPPEVPLVAGMTATVSVVDETANDGQAWTVDKGLAWVREAFDAVVSRPVTRPGCIPPIGRETGTTVTLPVEDVPSARLPANTVKPDLAPGMTVPPRR